MDKKNKVPTPKYRKRIQTLELIDDHPSSVMDTVELKPHQKKALREKESTLPTLSFTDKDATPEFELGALIAEGGMGRICSAKQIPLRRDVVIKMLREDKQTSEMKALLLQEACLTGFLEHPNIVPVYQLGKDEDEQPLLVMKQIGGVPWDELLEDRTLRPDALPEEQRTLDWHIRVLIQVCHAMEYAHSKGIIHRDIKPENVMIGEFGEVYVLDWGIAVSLDEEHIGHFPLVRDVDSISGTPAYIAPEMLTLEPGGLDEKTDVYLLGATLFQLLTGIPPHEVESLSTLKSKVCTRRAYPFHEAVPTELAELCNRSMEIDREHRPKTVGEFRVGLEAFLRNSASYRLSAEALLLFDELQEHLVSVGPAVSTLSMFTIPKEDNSKEIYSLFWRCHFGLTQSLQISNGNTEARKGLQKLLESMTYYEIHKRDLRAADALVAELPEPNPELVKRLEKLRKDQAEKAKSITELKKIKFEHDAELGKRTRRAAILLLGITFGLVSCATFFLGKFNIYQAEHYGFLTNDVAFLVVLGSIIFIWRRVFFENRANRQIVSFVLFFGFVLISLRLMYIQLGVSVAVGGTMDSALLFTFVGILAIVQDWRIFIVSFCYFVVFVTTIFWPDGFLLYLGCAHVLGAIGISFVWR